MGAFAAILVGLGIIALIWGAMQKYKAGRLASAPYRKTGEVAQMGMAVAGDRGAVSVEGAVSCPQVLIAPVSGTPCLFYEVEAVARWKDGDSEKSKEVVKEKTAAQFAVDDGSGYVMVHAAEGGDYDPMEKTFDETRGAGILGGVKAAFTGEGMPFGNHGFTMPAGSFPVGTRFTVTERVLKPQPRLYVCGKVHEAGGIGSPSWTALILSGRSRDELLGSTAKTARNFLMGGAAAAGVGTLLGIVSKFI